MRRPSLMPPPVGPRVGVCEHKLVRQLPFAERVLQCAEGKEDGISRRQSQRLVDLARILGPRASGHGIELCRSAQDALPPEASSPSGRNSAGQGTVMGSARWSSAMIWAPRFCTRRPDRRRPRRTPPTLNVGPGASCWRQATWDLRRSSQALAPRMQGMHEGGQPSSASSRKHPASTTVTGGPIGTLRL